MDELGTKKRTVEENLEVIRLYLGLSLWVLAAIAVLLGIIAFGDGIQVEIARL